MRLSNRIIVIVGFAVIAVVLGLTASYYLQAVAEHGALEDRLAVAETRVPALTAEKEDLQNEETQAMSKLRTSQARFPEAVDSIKYGEDLFDLAVKSNVRITRLTASAPSNTERGGVTYSTSSFSLVVQGDVANILDFVHSLRTAGDSQLPWSVELGGINVDYGGRRASISLTVYAFKG